MSILNWKGLGSGLAYWLIGAANYSFKWINEKAKQLNVNLEDLIVKLIHDQIKSDQNGIELMQYHDLDSLAGTWSRKEADDFIQAIDKFNQIDESIWQ